MENKYVIFSTSELHLINFDEVLETSIDTVRRSLDGTKTFVNYYGQQPESVSKLTTKSVEYSYEEIIHLVSTPEWVDDVFP